MARVPNPPYAPRAAEPGFKSRRPHQKGNVYSLLCMHVLSVVLVCCCKGIMVGPVNAATALSSACDVRDHWWLIDYA